MILISSNSYSFAEYLAYCGEDDTKYELFDGELKEMTPASGQHADIMCFLYEQFNKEIKRLNYDWVVRPGNVGVRTGAKKARIPDLVIITETQRQELRNQTAVLENPPILVVEIVSPGNPEDDYRYKRSEYAVAGIAEYWIVDPMAGQLMILQLIDGFYNQAVFTGTQTIISPTFPEFNLTVEQILSA